MPAPELIPPDSESVKAVPVVVTPPSPVSERASFTLDRIDRRVRAVLDR